MTDITVALSSSLIGMTTQLNRAVMTRSLFLETPHGIHAHCGFCTIWVRGHTQNAEANTRLQMSQPPTLAGCSALCYTDSPTAALALGRVWGGGQAAWWCLPSPGPCRLPSSAAPRPSWPGRCWWCCCWARLPSSCGPCNDRGQRAAGATAPKVPHSPAGLAPSHPSLSCQSEW